MTAPAASGSACASAGALEVLDLRTDTPPPSPSLALPRALVVVEVVLRLAACAWRDLAGDGGTRAVAVARPEWAACALCCGDGGSDLTTDTDTSRFTRGDMSSTGALMRFVPSSSVSFFSV